MFDGKIGVGPEISFETASIFPASVLKCKNIAIK
jgi:hypothetical protein